MVPQTEPGQAPTLNPRELAIQHQLGKRGQTYHESGSYKFGMFVTILFILAMAIVLLVFSLVQAKDALLDVPDGVTFASYMLYEGWRLLGLAIFLGLLSGFFIWLMGKVLYKMLTKRESTTICYDEGLIRLSKERAEVIRWDQVEEVYRAVTRRYVNGVYINTSYSYTVCGKDGKGFFLGDWIKDVADLGDRIVQSVTQRMLPETSARYQAGERVSFGKLSLDQQGLTWGKKRQRTLPWEKFGSIKVEKGNLVIRKKGRVFNLKWLEYPVGSIPNVFVFLALEQVVNKYRPEA